MMVTVVTKAGCPRCLLLKQKLERLGVEYDEIEDLLAGLSPEMKLPVVKIDGEYFEYAAAIAKLKGS